MNGLYSVKKSCEMTPIFRKLINPKWNPKWVICKKLFLHINKYKTNKMSLWIRIENNFWLRITNCFYLSNSSWFRTRLCPGVGAFFWDDDFSLESSGKLGILTKLTTGIWCVSSSLLEKKLLEVVTGESVLVKVA